MAAAPQLPKSFEEAARQHLAVEEELERVCGSVYFRSSRRSCEFLQYVVRVTLDGRVDSLKERSIGIDLLGRDSSYEPSSDATVRVRANEVRKRLSSYYTSAMACDDPRELQIDLPLGSYVPKFLPIADHAKPARPALPHFLAEHPAIPAEIPEPRGIPQIVPPVAALTLIRPALLALLVCTLMLRHQLENREEYLRFWDRLLSGRNAMVLAVAPQDRPGLASSLYPLIWVAGRYGVDAILQEDSLVGANPEAASSVRVGYVTPTEAVSDRRLRWVLTDPEGEAGSVKTTQTRTWLVDRNPGNGKPGTSAAFTSVALLTIFPESKSILLVGGTDADAIRHLLEELTMGSDFPAGMVERIEHLDSRHVLQVLVMRNASGEWRRSVSWGDS